MIRVENVEKYKGSTLRVDLSEGEPVFLNSETVMNCSVRKGESFTEEQWAEVIHRNDFRRARERALHLLDRRDYSYTEMFKKLLENYPEPLCYEVCDRLAELGMINDRRYAEGLARRYMEVKHFGRYRAVQEMRLKGIPSELIDEALEPYSDSESTRERIRELVEQKYLRRLADEDGVKKVKNALVRQGYSFRDINAVFDELEEDE